MEAERRIPQSLVAAMKSAGLFRLSMPRAMGGPELTPMAQVQVVEALSMFDASVGWTAMLGLHAGYFTALLDPAAARSMYVDGRLETGRAELLGLGRPQAPNNASPQAFGASAPELGISLQMLRAVVALFEFAALQRFRPSARASRPCRGQEVSVRVGSTREQL